MTDRIDALRVLEKAEIWDAAKRLVAEYPKHREKAGFDWRAEIQSAMDRTRPYSTGGRCVMQYAGIQGCGWVRCRWSGFKLHSPSRFEEIAQGWHYAGGALVLGFWVYQWRVWLKPITTPAQEGGE